MSSERVMCCRFASLSKAWLRPRGACTCKISGNRPELSASMKIPCSVTFQLPYEPNSDRNYINYRYLTKKIAPNGSLIDDQWSTSSVDGWSALRRAAHQLMLSRPMATGTRRRHRRIPGLTRRPHRNISHILRSSPNSFPARNPLAPSASAGGVFCCLARCR
jgi:hypothetical protein